MKTRILCIAGLLVFGCGGLRAKKPQSLDARIGVCSDVRNAQRLKAAGADCLEAGVSAPGSGQAGRGIRQNLALLRESGSEIVSCNGFLPASMIVVGPSTDHEKDPEMGRNDFSQSRTGRYPVHRFRQRKIAQSARRILARNGRRTIRATMQTARPGRRALPRDGRNRTAEQPRNEPDQFGVGRRLDRRTRESQKHPAAVRPISHDGRRRAAAGHRRRRKAYPALPHRRSRRTDGPRHRRGRFSSPTCAR